MHWYGTKFEDLKSALNAYHTAFGKPIWLTEFACQACRALYGAISYSHFYAYIELLWWSPMQQGSGVQFDAVCEGLLG